MLNTSALSEFTNNEGSIYFYSDFSILNFIVNIMIISGGDESYLNMYSFSSSSKCFLMSNLLVSY